ncbi:MAG TPA: choice-of-anchor Q domain-containing protein [Blastocatellia bacterium]|nr:choice-of-anchor Q domain-containing protein [Blastocatellia bacterium]
MKIRFSTFRRMVIVAFGITPLIALSILCLAQIQALNRTAGDGREALPSHNKTAPVDSDATAGATLAISVSFPTPLGVGMKYYVSPGGSDSNPGTQALPFKTIQRAADIVDPGDTVIVEDGVYTMGVPHPSCSPITAVVCLTKGGTPGKWIVFKSRNPWGAKIDGENNRVQNGFRFATPTANYLRFEGFDVYGMGNDGSAAGFEIYKGGHDIQIAGNHIHHIGRFCVNTTNGNVGIYISQDNVLVEGNTIHDIGRFGPGEDGCNPPNKYWQNHDHGVYHSRGNDVTIRNNIFYNHHHGWAIQAYPHSRARTTIVNNTFSGSNPNQTGHIVMSGGGELRDVKIVNNIFHQPNSAAIDVGSAKFINVVISNNLTTSGRIIDQVNPAGITTINNLLSTDPKFINPSAFDFRLLPDSPAIDAGASIPEASNDRSSRIRPQGTGFDIGAHEYAVPTSQMTPKSPPSKTGGLPKAGGASAGRRRNFGLPQARGSSVWRIANVR